MESPYPIVIPYLKFLTSPFSKLLQLTNLFSVTVHSLCAASQMWVRHRKYSSWGSQYHNMLNHNRFYCKSATSCIERNRELDRCFCSVLYISLTLTTEKDKFSVFFYLTHDLEILSNKTKLERNSIL